MDNGAVDDHAVEAGAVVRVNAKTGKVRAKKRDENVADFITECRG